MLTTGAYLLIALAVALIVGLAWRPQATGWLLIAIGACFLIHAGVTMAIIWAHNNVVPPYVNYWGLFATIPTGVVLLSAGIGINCTRSCLARMKQPRK
jgi:hypothetical protein